MTYRLISKELPVTKPETSLATNISISQLIAAGGKPVKKPCKPIFSEILPGKLYIANYEGAQDIQNIKVSSLINYDKFNLFIKFSFFFFFLFFPI
jgi:hypothetical protein